MEVTGTAVTYNREATMPAASFYDVGDTWTEATPTFTQVTAALKIMGGDADVDNFLQATYADPNDIEAEVIASRAKAVAHLFSDTFFNGDSAVNAKAFDGLTKAIPAGQTVAAGANGGALTLDLMDQVIDLVKPGRPDALLMSKRTRRKLNALRRASGTCWRRTSTSSGSGCCSTTASRSSSTTSSPTPRRRGPAARSAPRSTASSSGRASG